MPVEVNRPLLQRNRTGSIFDATCFTTNDPARVAENKLMKRVYTRSARP